MAKTESHGPNVGAAVELDIHLAHVAAVSLAEGVDDGLTAASAALDQQFAGDDGGVSANPTIPGVRDDRAVPSYTAKSSNRTLIFLE